MIGTREVRRDGNGRWVRGEHPHNFKGYGKGRIGLLIHCPEHPKANNGQVPDYILMAEAALGKPIPIGVVIHHHTIDKLVVCQDQSYHLLLEKRTRAFLQCGNADWGRCYVCKQWDSKEHLDSKSRHPKCISEYNKIHRGV